MEERGEKKPPDNRGKKQVDNIMWDRKQYDPRYLQDQIRAGQRYRRPRRNRWSLVVYSQIGRQDTQITRRVSQPITPHSCKELESVTVLVIIASGTDNSLSSSLFMLGLTLDYCRRGSKEINKFPIWEKLMFGKSGEGKDFVFRIVENFRTGVCRHDIHA